MKCVAPGLRLAAALVAFVAVGAGTSPRLDPVEAAAVAAADSPAGTAAEELVRHHSRARLDADFAAVQTFRPAYQFWQHIFQIPDGRIVFGSARDGRLLATFPAQGDWGRQAVWVDSALAPTLAGQRLSANLNQRRDRVVQLMEPIVGPVMHNPSRGLLGRTVINGERLGGRDARQQYLLGAQLAHDLRDTSIRRYRELFRTYGPRSFLYAEMVFGNTLNVARLTAETPQTPIVAMRAPRAIPLAEISRRTGLSVDEIKRFNPALVSQVTARSDLYLPRYVAEFGADVSFWHRPASAAYASVLNEFIQLDATVAEWHEPRFESTLKDFETRFKGTDTEEGAVMATTLAFVIEDLRTSRRAAILQEFRTSARVLRLLEEGRRELAAAVPGGQVAGLPAASSSR